LKSSSLIQSSNIYQENPKNIKNTPWFLEKILIKTLRKSLARHNQTNLSIKKIKKHIFKVWNSDYTKEMKRKDESKLENEQQGRKCKGNKLSGFQPRELHQRKLKHKKLK
jgi:hypothetical protein